MDIKFSCASGSPYAWRIWLALEHKALPYELKIITYSSGDLQAPEFMILNRKKAPVLVVDGFVFYESQVVLEFLEDAYPDLGQRLFPEDVRQRALARRYIRYAEVFVAQALETMAGEILFKPVANWNGQSIIQARTTFVDELAYFEKQLSSDFLSGDHAGAADFSLYPMIALALRLEISEPDLGIQAGIGPKVSAWMKRIEALPYYAKTYPAHWKATV
ncbi:MAG TPA: glutathione S-transferase family protein [Burkholderiales bacterium]|jgi:glutathione S-transferase|nr:glutathione S-transferase family protein [Burkholderiales bacterium]